MRRHPPHATLEAHTDKTPGEDKNTGAEGLGRNFRNGHM